MSTIWNVRQLRVYQRVLKLLPLLYDLVYSIPEHHQKLRKQILSCGEGIAPLIAEGFAKRRNIAEFLRFLEMAMAESIVTVLLITALLLHCSTVLLIHSPVETHKKGTR